MGQAKSICVAELGRTPYGACWELQQDLFARRAEGLVGDLLLLTEHDHVYTIGTGGTDLHLLAGEEELRTRGASRTDAGVHALGQVCSFQWPREPDTERLRRSISGMQGPDLRVESVEVVPDEFDARFSATAKRYAYAVSLAKFADPFAARYAWLVPWQLTTKLPIALARSTTATATPASAAMIPTVRRPPPPLRRRRGGVDPPDPPEPPEDVRDAFLRETGTLDIRRRGSVFPAAGEDPGRGRDRDPGRRAPAGQSARIDSRSRRSYAPASQSDTLREGLSRDPVSPRPVFSEEVCLTARPMSRRGG